MLSSRKFIPLILPIIFKSDASYLHTRDSIMFDHLIERIGYPWSVRAIALLLIPLQLISIFTVRSRLTHNRKHFNPLGLLRPFKDVIFSLNAAATFFGILGLPIPFTYLKVAGEAAGVKPSLSIYLLPILNSVRYVDLFLEIPIPISSNYNLTYAVQYPWSYPSSLGRGLPWDFQHSHYLRYIWCYPNLGPLVPKPRLC